MPGPPLSLGYLHSTDPTQFLEFVCQACPHWVRKPLGEMVVIYGEEKLLKDINPPCSRCGARNATVRVWRDTWSGPRG